MPSRRPHPKYIDLSGESGFPQGYVELACSIQVRGMHTILVRACLVRTNLAMLWSSLLVKVVADTSASGVIVVPNR